MDWTLAIIFVCVFCIGFFVRWKAMKEEAEMIREMEKVKKNAK